MRKIILMLIPFISLVGFGQSQTRKVLFLGNSYTQANNLPLIVSELATNTGDILIYDSNTPGGYTLENHSTSTISQNKILSNDWDYIVLQEQSQRPAFLSGLPFFNGFVGVESFIRQNKPCAQISSFMTWGYENGDTQNCPSNPTVCTYDGMQNLISERYMDFSNVLESEVTPVGVVWKYIRENYPDINLYQSDGSHPSVAGSYLAACCFYTSLYRKNPALITTNYGLDATTASIIRNATKSIIFDHPLDWYIGKYVPSAGFNYMIGNGSNEIIINNNASTYSDSFLWEFGDGVTSTNTLPTHSYTADGNYTVRLTANKCFLGQNLTSIFERTVTFCAHNNTIFPNDLLLCPNETAVIWTQPADSYQWCDYLGEPIPGATNQSLEVFPDSYSVLTTINGCTERSPQIIVDGYGGIGENDPCNLGTIDIDKPLEIKIFPNPAQNILNIQSQETLTEVSVYNMLGIKVIANQIYTNFVDVSSLASGIYIIKIIGENNKIYSSKFIKE